ncbi:hypothetical protein EW145_g4940 [Phellinidium pouzarii]|uniref:Uncharacterized protein n=1 Tax=Phellinidium pouzarii TaxID=167371 RepID=A0A4S4L1Q2_9AGAM|nr:hypothetical protein EW145_g4940 [Phellinidium pouzarii]
MDDVVPSSPTSSCSDNSDAVNSSSAKIYFGPIQSPEKKFAPMLSPSLRADDGPVFSTSNSILPESTLCCEEEVEGGEQDEEEGRDEVSLANKQKPVFPGQSWQGTTFHDLLRNDEPSSAIATRIMRAHDNPSPPPKAIRPSLTTRRTSKLANELIFPSNSNSEECSDTVVESLLPSSNDHVDTPTPPPFDLLETSPLATPTKEWLDVPSPTLNHAILPPSSKVPQTDTDTTQIDAEPDLIFFDRSVIISQYDDHASIHAPSPRHAQQPQQTVDDLLFSSPPHPAFPAVELSGDVRVSLSPTPGPSAPRRSPRLSALLHPAAELLNTPRATNQTRSPNTDGTQARKRHRDGTKKSTRLSLTPSKVDWSLDSDSSESESDSTRSPSKRIRNDRKRLKNRDEVINDMGNLQLAESLSSGSAQILSTLVSSNQDAATSITDVEMKLPRTLPLVDSVTQCEFSTKEPRVEEPGTPHSSAQLSVQRPPPGFHVSHTLTPTPGSSGMRPLLALNSPVKLTLTPAPDDSNRTPARRVPLFSHDHSRANLGTSETGIPFGINHTPVFSRPLVNNPNRSPARRVQVSDPVRKEVDCFEDAITLKATTDEARSRIASTEVEPPAAVRMPALDKPSSSNTNAVATLVEPSSKRVFLGPSAKTSSTIAAMTLKPVNSNSSAGSRIPRIGALPKPASSTRMSRLPTLSVRKPNSSKAPTLLPKKLPRLYNNSSSGSEDSVSGPASTDSLSASGPMKNATAAYKTDNKQKLEKATPARPMIKMRQVIPGMFGGPVKNTSLIGTEKETEDQSAFFSPVKRSAQQKGPIKVREVVRGTLQDFELRTTSFKSLEALSEARAKERAELDKANENERKEMLSAGPSLQEFTFECSAFQRAEEGMDESIPANSMQSFAEGMGGEAASQSDGDLSANSGARRSTRNRQTTQQNDVFGAFTTLDSKPTSVSRRRSSVGPTKSRTPSNLVFHSNGLALKTLTNNNTTRNQNYYAQLEMHVIRKAGNRPESPTMKLRTILEKQKEEQDKMRAERARRRRGDEGDPSMDFEMQDSIGVQPTKHRRGPGEEEDYVSPVRPANGKKGVKWDRGLETSVFIDEIEVQSGKRPISESAPTPRKGCIIMMPNRAPLDSLGNAVNADAPLKLAPEKVLVTKYVYDNDEEAQVELPKTTRRLRSFSN